MSRRWSRWWLVIAAARPARSPKRWRCAGRTSSASRPDDLVQRVEEVAERVAAAVAPRDRDVRRDRRQDVVARQQQALLGSVEAQVPGRVAGRPHRADVPPRYVDALTVVHRAVRRGERAEAACPSTGGRCRRGGQLVLGGAGVDEHRHQLVGEVGQRLRRLAVAAILAGHRVRQVLDGDRVALVHRHPRVRRVAHPARQAVVVGVDVGDQHAVALGDVGTGGAEPGDERIPRLVVVPPGVDQHRATIGLDQVDERVAERVVREGDADRPQAGSHELGRRQGRWHPATIGGGGRWAGVGFGARRHRRAATRRCRANGLGGNRMGTINQGRWTAEIEGDFVVFLIGARPSPLHLIRSLVDLGGRRGMKHMLDHLVAHPDKGLLGYELGFKRVRGGLRQHADLQVGQGVACGAGGRGRRRSRAAEGGHALTDRAQRASAAASTTATSSASPVALAATSGVWSLNPAKRGSAPAPSRSRAAPV